MTPALLINLFAILITLVLVFFIWKLNRQIILLRKAKREIKYLLKSFNDDISWAKNNLPENKSGKFPHTEQSKKQTEETKHIINELTSIVNKACSINEKLENNIDKIKNISPEKNNYNQRLQAIEKQLFGKFSTKKGPVLTIDQLIEKINTTQNTQRIQKEEPFAIGRTYFFKQPKPNS